MRGERHFHVRVAGLAVRQSRIFQLLARSGFLDRLEHLVDVKIVRRLDHFHGIFLFGDRHDRACVVAAWRRFARLDEDAAVAGNRRL